ncbi:MAG: DUF4403 family protein [Chitinophagales bacterium]|nr:DUF4403 family protein [Chitinophagales bacterium]
MSIFDRILGDTSYADIWEQLQKYLFTNKRWLQLLTLKPIEIYKQDTTFEIDTAKVDLSIQSYVENIVQKRIENTRRLLSFNIASWSKNTTNYKFNILLKAKANYKEIGNFFNFHFAKQTYDIEPNRYSIYIDSFTISSVGTKAEIVVPFKIHAKWWKFKRTVDGIATLICSLSFNHPRYTIRTRNLNYTLQTESKMLKWIDSNYHQEIVKSLSDFLVYDFREEIQNAKILAQEQINSFQEGNSWISGTVNDLQLERITIDYDALRGFFLAEGNIEVLR